MHLCLFSEFALYVWTEWQLARGIFLAGFSDMDNGELLSLTLSLFLTKKAVKSRNNWDRSTLQSCLQMVLKSVSGDQITCSQPRHIAAYNMCLNVPPVTTCEGKVKIL